MTGDSILCISLLDHQLILSVLTSYSIFFDPTLSHKGNKSNLTNISNLSVRTWIHITAKVLFIIKKSTISDCTLSRHIKKQT